MPLRRPASRGGLCRRGSPPGCWRDVSATVIGARPWVESLRRVGVGAREVLPRRLAWTALTFPGEDGKMQGASAAEARVGRRETRRMEGATPSSISTSLPGRLLLGTLGVYRRTISPMLPPRCRFYPSCSAYAMEAVVSHGAARGSGLALLRLLRCHPLHRGGFDPVPPARPGTSRG